MESQDYEYPVEAWLQDMEMELGNAGEYEKRLEFCNKVLEMFDWTYVAEDGFRCAVGEELYEAGKIEEAIEEGDTLSFDFSYFPPHEITALILHAFRRFMYESKNSGGRPRALPEPTQETS